MRFLFFIVDSCMESLRAEALDTIQHVRCVTAAPSVPLLSPASHAQAGHSSAFLRPSACSRRYARMVCRIGRANCTFGGRNGRSMLVSLGN
jgi:hypothetical protein